MVIGQVEGGAEVIDAATRHSWEAGAVAVVLLVMIGGIAYLMRALWTVNTRLADRVTNLESQLTDKLMSIVESTTSAVAANTQMLDRTAKAIDKLEEAVEHSLRTQQNIMARIDTSPCLMVQALSEETQVVLDEARRTALEKANQSREGK